MSKSYSTEPYHMRNFRRVGSKYVPKRPSWAPVEADFGEQEWDASRLRAVYVAGRRFEAVGA